MNSTTHTAWEDFLASHYNDLRKDVLTRGDYVVATWSSNAFVVALDAQIVAYETGMRVIFKANHTITGAPTINVNAIGVKNIVNRDTSSIIKGIRNGNIYTLIYNGTSFVLQNKDIETYYSLWDGSDGTVIFDGSTTILGMVPAGNVYTMTRDINTVDMTVNTGISVNPAWYAIYSTGTLTLSGTAKIIRNGNNGTNAVNSTSGGAWAVWVGGTALATWTCWPNLGGWNGASGSLSWTPTTSTAGVAVSPSYATTSTASTQWWAWWIPFWWAGAWWGGAAGTTAVATQWLLYNTCLDLAQVLTYAMSPARWLFYNTPYGGLPSSTGWGGWQGNSGWVNYGWSGGWSGWNGWIIFIYANAIAGSWTIESKGWNWWNGSAGNIQGGGGGWGAWWNWGIICIIYASGTPWTRTLTGWTGWTGYIEWVNWSAWTVWQSILINV